MRTIDADALKADFRLNFGSVHDAVIACQIVDRQPTLTPPNEALTPEELREMGEQPYWHVGLREESPPPHWNILDPFCAKRIEDYKYGKNWIAYRRPPEGEEDT